MKKIAAVLLMLLSFNAMAAQAYMVSCTPSTSVTGRFVYVGVYDLYGRRFQQVFEQYCPYYVDVR